MILSLKFWKIKGRLPTCCLAHCSKGCSSLPEGRKGCCLPIPGPLQMYTSPIFPASNQTSCFLTWESEALQSRWCLKVCSILVTASTLIGCNIYYAPSFPVAGWCPGWPFPPKLSDSDLCWLIMTNFYNPEVINLGIWREKKNGKG